MRPLVQLAGREGTRALRLALTRFTDHDVGAGHRPGEQHELLAELAEAEENGQWTRAAQIRCRLGRPDPEPVHDLPRGL